MEWIQLSIYFSQTKSAGFQYHISSIISKYSVFLNQEWSPNHQMMSSTMMRRNDLSAPSLYTETQAPVGGGGA